MKMRRFTGKDTRTALQKVRDALGADAVIMSSTQTPEGIEIVAAVDYDQNIIRDAGNAATEKEFDVPEFDTNLQQLQFQVDELKLMLGELLDSNRWQSINQQSPINSKLLSYLQRCGLSEKLALQLIKNVHEQKDIRIALEQTLLALAEQLGDSDNAIINKAGIYAFVGPTGVGKTTTIAKLASRYALQHGNDKVALVTIDNYRIAATEHLATYAKILDVPMFKAEDRQQLNNVLEKLSDKELILIDTAGFVNHDNRVQSQIDMLAQLATPVNLCLVLSASASIPLLQNSLQTYGCFGLAQVILTKIDECLQIGNVIDLCISHSITPSYLSNGQKVPEDIIPLSSKYLISLMLEQTPTQTSQPELSARRSIHATS